MLKRSFDIVVSLAGTVLLFIPLLIVAALIKFDSSGPVFFKQDRVGKNGKIFKLYKLRTMSAGADKIWKDNFKLVNLSGYFFQSPVDPRITRMGKLLRRGIDELPQFINVLKGEMSLVGPRPEIPEIVGLYTGKQRQLLQVLPGLVCLSSIKGRGALSTEQIINYDLDYLSERSFLLDIKIMLIALWVSITGKGAR